jgi:hypothetical protein
VAGNVGAGGIEGTTAGYKNGQGMAADFVAGNYTGAPPVNLFPKSGSALNGAGSAAHVTDSDFNGTPRAGVADAGAYKFDAGGNPGWTLSPSFKGISFVQPNPPTNVTAN